MLVDAFECFDRVLPGEVSRWSDQLEMAVRASVPAGWLSVRGGSGGVLHTGDPIGGCVPERSADVAVGG